MSDTRTKAQINYDKWWSVKNYEKRIDFIENAIRETKFYFGEQWTKEQKDRTESMGQTAIVINEIRRAFRQIINAITAKVPSGKLYNTQGSEAEVLQAARDMMSYIWYISDGTTENERAIIDMLIRRIGVLHVYLDTEADYGRGEIKFTSEDILDVYIDPLSTKSQFRDARYIILSKLIDLESAKKDPKLGRIKGLERAVTGFDMDEYSMYGTKSSNYPFYFYKVPGTKMEDFLRIIETYEKVRINHTIVRNKLDGRVVVLDEKYADDSKLNDLAKKGLVDIAIIPVTRIKKSVSIMDRIWLGEEILPISEYPFAFFYTEDSKNPYPKSELTHAKYEQEFINKFYSLAILNMQLMGLPKILAEEGQIQDVDEWRKTFAVPGGVNQFTPSSTGNPPIVIPAQQFQSGWFGLASDLRMQIQRTIGAYDLGAGDPTQAPATWKATAALLERQVQNSTGILRSLRKAYEQLFNVILEWMPHVYTIEKVVDIIDDEGHPIITTINSPRYNTAGELLAIERDITTLKAKIRIGLGSMLPSNRFMYQLLFSELAQVNPIFLKQMIKYMDDLPGKDEIIKELDALPQMQAQLKQAEEAINQMKNRNNQLQQQLEQSLMHNRVNDFEVGLKKKLADMAVAKKAIAE